MYLPLKGILPYPPLKLQLRFLHISRTQTTLTSLTIHCQELFACIFFPLSILPSFSLPFTPFFAISPKEFLKMSFSKKAPGSCVCFPPIKSYYMRVGSSVWLHNGNPGNIIFSCMLDKALNGDRRREHHYLTSSTGLQNSEPPDVWFSPLAFIFLFIYYFFCHVRYLFHILHYYYHQLFCLLSWGVVICYLAMLIITALWTSCHQYSSVSYY